MATERKKKSDPKMDRQKKSRSITPWFMAILIFLIFLVILESGGLGMGRQKMDFSEYREKVAANEVSQVFFLEDEAKGQIVLADDLEEKRITVHFQSADRAGAEMVWLQENHREVKVTSGEMGFLRKMTPFLLPIVIFIVILYFLFVRQLKSPGMGGTVLSFGKSPARLAEKSENSVTFDDVAGIDEAKEEVQEIIEFLKNPARFQRLGGRVPRGVLLVGAPGTGKTLLARAIAGEASVPFFNICGSDFVEMFVGVGASRVRDLFKQAKDTSPCIVFLDEVDAVGRRRGSGLGGGHDEREQTLNAILVEMDGFESDEGIIVMAATNRPDVLDPALLRPGRFDRQIYVDLPDVIGREQIIRVHSRGVKLAPDVNLGTLARGTPSFSGAELEAMVNEAAILAAMRDKDSVGMEELEETRDKVRWGRQKRSRAMDEADRRVTAYHEAGHALMAHLLPEVEPLHKVTIIPRGMALGATMQLPEGDKYHMQKKTLLGNLMVLYGGRVSEEISFGDISTGAKDDIERATELARAMVCEWGMSDALGPISFSDNEETLFLGREITRRTSHSDHTVRIIDEEVSKILTESYKKTTERIEQNRESLERIAEALLKHEVLTGSEVGRLIKGESIATIKRSAPSRARSRESAPAEPAPESKGKTKEDLDDGLAGARGSEAVS
ncbi:MAG: ATP-dependent zinc metalloprotease FtsH [Planctomycetota bacterium]|nr:ATP-dependent zinc metalloprotease FtsH [Planctomycetota bacterium]